MGHDGTKPRPIDYIMSYAVGTVQGVALTFDLTRHRRENDLSFLAKKIDKTWN